MYRPKSLVLDGLHPHPNKAIESESMKTVNMPNLTYVPHQKIIDLAYQGKFSDLQLESICYAGQSHSQMIGEKRAGFFIGDGTGLGKGRQVAGIIADNFYSGNRKAVWISVSSQLELDARRDIIDTVGYDIPLFSLASFKMDSDIPKDKEGVLFVTYSTMIRGKEDDIDARLNQILRWLSDCPNAVIIFDEAHAAKNAVGGNLKKASRRGSLVIDIQDKLPLAKVVYVSATGATVIDNMAYMNRLGLWGDGCVFADFNEFKTEVEAGGIGALELIARELKAMGRYVSRFISYDNVEFQTIMCEMSKENIQMYNDAAVVWQEILASLDNVIDNIVGANLSNKSKSRLRANAYSQFWSSQQRFFKTLIVASKLDKLIPYIQNRILEHNESIVIALFSTGESAMNRKMAEITKEGLTESDIDFTPREIIIDYLNKCFPTKVVIETENVDGNITLKYVNEYGTEAKDGDKHLESQAALEHRSKLLEKAMSISFPDNPIDRIINEMRLFAKIHNNPTYQCGEITGRKSKLIYDIRDGQFTSTKTLVKRGSKASQVDKEMFQSGDYRCIVISSAGSTGISLHADRNCKNQTRRHLICLETAWSADVQIQFFGRVHRSNQTSDPIISMTDSGIPAERRFISTIGKRMESLGAITRGDRKSSGGNKLINLENQYGKAALCKILNEL